MKSRWWGWSRLYGLLVIWKIIARLDNRQTMRRYKNFPINRDEVKLAFYGNCPSIPSNLWWGRLPSEYLRKAPFASAANILMIDHDVPEWFEIQTEYLGRYNPLLLSEGCQHFDRADTLPKSFGKAFELLLRILRLQVRLENILAQAECRRLENPPFFALQLHFGLRTQRSAPNPRW